MLSRLHLLRQATQWLACLPLAYWVSLSVCLGTWLTPQTSHAQLRNRRDSTYCAAPELSDTQRKNLDQLAKLALQLKRASGNAFTGVVWVPVRPHIIRTTAGTGGIGMTQLNNVIARTNSYYMSNGVGIQFYLVGTTPDYINNDVLYQSFPYGDESGINGRDATDAMNVYFVNNFSLSGLQGYAYFPENSLQTTRSFILANATSTDKFLGDILIPHEWGHNFNLFHTFQGSTSSSPELVTRSAGANCTTAGDLLCDTPADPYGRSGASITTINGCPVYNGTATDPQGATYNPSMTNIMSYYDGCFSDFTPRQYDRIEAGLALRQSHTAYSLTAAPTAVNAPTNLQAVVAPSGFVSLNWQDNATNEMGYLVERGISANGPFVPIGGNAPNGTNFTDQKAALSMTYFYRVRPSNTTTGAISNITSVATGSTTVCVPSLAYGCTQNDGLTNLFVNGSALSYQSGCSPNGYHAFTVESATVTAGQTCQLTGRLLSTVQTESVAIFLDLDRNGTFAANERVYGQNITGQFSGTFALPNTLTAGPLNMRVIVLQSGLAASGCLSGTYGETEDYTLTVVTNSCTAPASVSTVPLEASALVNWNAAAGATSYELRWRPLNQTTWFSPSLLSATTYTLTALTTGPAYTWQVRSVCNGGNSVWVGDAFSTGCPSPTSLTATAITGTSATLNWTSSSSSFDLAWRVDGSTVWQTVSGIATPSYVLTGLLAGRSYQWQVRCAGVDNAYSPIASFVTAGTCRATYNTGCVEGDGFNVFTFNGVMMSQNSGCSVNGYRRYTTPVAPVKPGQSYSFSGVLLSASYSQGISIWLDLNRNNVFESGERLYTSPTTYVTSFTGSLTVPASATPGPLTMRVMAAYNTIPTDPCGSHNYGEIEDYQVMVYADDVVQLTRLPDPACLTTSLPISFGTTSPFASGNLFTAQLSDAAGTFASPLAVGSVSGTTSNSMAITIPATVAAGNGYQLRVVSSDPATTNNPATPLRITATCACPVPTSLTTSALTLSAVNLTWTCDATVSSYSLRWRAVNGSWVQVNGLTTTEYFIPSLVTGNSYEWQVSANCQNGQTSDWSSMGTFQTTTCSTPTQLITSAISVSAALVNWSGTTSSYELRWKPLSSSTWSTTAINATSATLTYLTANTPYEWQVRSVCSSSTSPYAASAYFTTAEAPSCLSMVTTKSGQWNDATVWSCGRVPNSSDNVTITNGHVIVIPASTTVVASQLTNNGRLNFEASTSQLQLGVASFGDGLIAYYPFNGNANDESGNGYNGTLNGPVLATDRFGNANKAYSFDGTDDKIDVNSLPNYIGKISTEFSVSTWFKPAVAYGNSTVRNTFMSVPEGLYQVYYEQGNLRLEVWANPSHTVSIYSVPMTFAANTWNHVVCSVRAGLPVKMYINGQEFVLGNAPSLLDFDSGTRTQFGYEPNFNMWMNGSLDDIRIYNRALTSTQAKALYYFEAPVNLTSGLVARYPFNGNANDESGNSQNGTVTGATLTTDRFGNADKAYTFGGSQQYINIGTLPLMPLFSISGWVNPAQYGSFQCLLSGINSDYSYQNFELRVEYDGNYSISKTAFLHVPYANDWPAITSDNVIPLNTWTHITATWDGKYARIYLDGELNKVQIMNGYDFVSATHFIGGRPGYLNSYPNHSWMNGKIDGVRVYNRALSPAEVKALHTDTTD